MKRTLLPISFTVVAFFLHYLSCPQSYPPLLPPSPDHLLGTTPLGQDALCYCLKGLWSSLESALSSAITTFSVLTLISIASLYFGLEALDSVLGLLAGFPRFSFLVFLAMITTLNPAMIGVIVGLFVSVSVAKSLVTKLKQLERLEFCEASRALGAGKLWLFVKHCFPHVKSLIMRYVAIASATAVYAEAGASMLGLEDPSIPSVGKLYTLVASSPGAVLTKAGQVQVLASALATTFIGVTVYFSLKG